MTDKEQTMDWCEKHRPKTFDEVEGNPNIVSLLRRFSHRKNFPRLMLVGDSGTGKTTIALILAKHLFDKSDYLELNASDERGIDTIRYDIPAYASTLSPYGNPFRVVIFDECENMTEDAQLCLRRTIEKYANNCKFILTCNELLPIIPQLHSRTRPLFFEPLKRVQIFRILKRIANKEGINHSKKELLKIARMASGDARTAVELLQSVAEGEDRIDPRMLNGLDHTVSYRKAASMLRSALNGKFERAVSRLPQVSTFMTSKSVFDYIYKNVTGDKEEESDSFFPMTEQEKERICIALSLTRSTYLNRTELLGFIARLSSSTPKHRDRVGENYD